MANTDVKVLGATSNVKINTTPKDADGNPTKLQEPIKYTSSDSVTNADENGLVVLPTDFNSNKPPIVITVAYKELSDTVTISGDDAPVASLSTTAEVVAK